MYYFIGIIELGYPIASTESKQRQVTIQAACLPEAEEKLRIWAKSTYKDCREVYVKSTRVCPLIT